MPRRAARGLDNFTQKLGGDHAFLATIAGANMTVLPLVLSGDMGLSPGAVGSLFAVQAAVSLAATIPVAKLADAWGPSTVIPPAMLVTAAAFATLPWADHLGYEYVACTMAVQGLGTCLLYTSPSPRDGLLSRMPSSA